MPVNSLTISVYSRILGTGVSGVIGLLVLMTKPPGAADALWQPDVQEFALRFTLSHPRVHTAIVGAAKRAEMLANARTMAAGPLPEALVLAGRQAFSKCLGSFR